MKQTLLNWRWWVAVPYILAIGIPAVLVDLVCFALVYAGEAAADFQSWLGPRLRCFWVPLRKWIYGAAP